jgi:hypothetical protein
LKAAVGAQDGGARDESEQQELLAALFHEHADHNIISIPSVISTDFGSLIMLNRYKMRLPPEGIKKNPTDGSLVLCYFHLIMLSLH